MAQYTEYGPFQMPSMIRGEFSTRRVWIDKVLLSPAKSQAVHNHSPDGFAWGYGGSGPAQLALALMLIFCDTEDQARALYQDFKWDVISKLPQRNFGLPVEKVEQWIQTKLG